MTARPVITPLDPDSPAGIAAAEALSQVLAEIQVAIWQRQAAAHTQDSTQQDRRAA